VIERMAAHAPGSAMDMKHEFTHPARVVEIGRDKAEDEEPDTDEFLPPAPAATDDGTPVTRVRRSETEPR
jgi:hypothetical protein